MATYVNKEAHGHHYVCIIQLVLLTIHKSRTNHIQKSIRYAADE